MIAVVTTLFSLSVLILATGVIALMIRDYGAAMLQALLGNAAPLPEASLKRTTPRRTVRVLAQPAAPSGLRAAA